MSGILIGLLIFIGLLVVLLIFTLVGERVDSAAEKRRKKGLKVVDIGNYSHGLYSWLITGTKAGRIEWKPMVLPPMVSVIGSTKSFKTGSRWLR